MLYLLLPVIWVTWESSWSFGRVKGVVFKSLSVSLECTSLWARLNQWWGVLSVGVSQMLCCCSSSRNLKISAFHVIAVNRVAYSSVFCSFLASSGNFTLLMFGFHVQPGICGTTVKSFGAISLVNFLFTCASLNITFQLVHLCLL